MAGRIGFASRHRGCAGAWTLALIAALVCSPSAWAAGPALLSAVSRMSHGGTNFDVQLPQTAPYSIECRGAGSTTLVMTFDQNVTAGTAAVTGGTGTAAAPTFSGATMSVALSNMTDGQQVTVTLSNVVGPGGPTPSVPISFRTLLGDVDGNGSISTHDITTVKVNINKSVAAGTMDGSNFRCDVDLNGSIGTHDLTTVKLAFGNTVAGGGAVNTPPTISTVADQTAIAGQASSPVGFTVGDAESAVTTLAISAVSSDQTLIPNANIALAGTGASKTFVITPLSSVSGTCQVTLSVSDGLAVSSVTFNVVISLPPTLYLATLRPMSGVNSLASGTATLSLAGDLKSAILKYSYSNLAGADSDDAIYVPSNQLVYDIPVAKLQGQQQPDGSYKWTFTTNPNANPNAAVIVSAIQSNVSSIIIESNAYPSGELQGVFQLVTGSQSFTAPAPIPPGFTYNPPSVVDASRFMQQAAFGGTFAEISSLSNGGAANASTALNDWLAVQFAMPIPISPTYSAVASPQANTFSSSSMYQQFHDRVCNAQAPNPYGDSLVDDRIHEAWWKNAITAPDQLRQRTATALSEIFVVSENDPVIDVDSPNHLPALATYYDMLADDAFGLFYDPITTNPCLLRDVTLHPIMGEYLNMMGNAYIVNNSPNENYAREVLQLFSVGLYMLQPDGSLMLDVNGAPIPTYDQPTITNFAHVFTGWNTSGAVVTWQTLISDGKTPAGAITSPSSTNWVLPMQPTQAHSNQSKQLLVYPNAAKWPGQTTPGFIPKDSGATASTELEFALANIFNHPNVGPFICRQLIKRLVGSNPSPAYVYRVAQVFANNGSNVRGDMKAVLTAILTDYEARNTASNATIINDPGYGHMREPMIRIANILRPLGAISKSNKWQIGKGDNTCNQTIFRSPTVFNFFNPTFIQPGPVQAAGLVSPEFDIIYETTITNTQNMIYTGIYATYITTAGATYGAPAANAGTGFRGDSAGSDVYLDFSTGTGNSLTSYVQTNGIPALIDRVGLLLMGAPMDPAMKSQIQTFVSNTSNVGATDYLGQCKAVVHLIATSPACATQK